MTADLIILGAGIAGLSAALGACDRGAFPLVLDAGGPPEAGSRFDVVFDDDFDPVGGPTPMSLSWACTRVLGLASPTGYHRRPGHIVDREALRQHLLIEALRRGAVVTWQSPVTWDDRTARVDGQDLPDVPVLLASRAFIPNDAKSMRRRLRGWQGRGTPVTSYLATPLSDANSSLLLAMTGADRWNAFGWQTVDAATPELPAGATLIYDDEQTVLIEPPVSLSGENWLRLGAAAGLEPRHGFGLAAKLALSRATGWQAADWTLQGSGLDAGNRYATWLSPYQHWLHTTPPRLWP